MHVGMIAVKPVGLSNMLKSILGGISPLFTVEARTAMPRCSQQSPCRQADAVQILHDGADLLNPSRVYLAWDRY
jgi:hypothetical protein